MFNSPYVVHGILLLSMSGVYIQQERSVETINQSSTHILQLQAVNQAEKADDSGVIAAQFEQPTLAVKPKIPEDPDQFVTIEADTKQYTCSGEAIYIASHSTDLTLKGYCSHVMVAATHSKIWADRIGVLKVYGDKSMVDVHAVDMVLVAGPSSRVFYGGELTKNHAIVAEVFGPNASVVRK